MRRILLVSVAILLTTLIITPSLALAQSIPSSPSDYSCFVYFTGVGCPHCARTDPIVLQKNLHAHPNVIVLEYEIYHDTINSPLLTSYNDKYNSGLGIPLLIINDKQSIIGDNPILRNIEQITEKSNHNPCLLLNKSSSISQLNLDSLPGKPKLWRADRVLLATASQNRHQGEEAKRYFLSNKNKLSSLVKNSKSSIKSNITIPLSGKKISFTHGIEIGNYLLAWNDKSSFSPLTTYSAQTNKEKTSTPNITNSSISWGKIISLASVDAINPCALAVLVLMLSSILIYNPRHKKEVIYSGISFILAVFILYFLYGILIIKAFQFVSLITPLRLWLYRGLAVLAIILGGLELKDFIHYKPGGFMTEMPLSLRPKVKKIISGVTSPPSAFIIGCFVTIFLLPCTIGPYVIAGGLLSQQEITFNTISRLLVYNIIFIIPMLLIIFLVYKGTSAIRDINTWRQKNIRQLHLGAAIILIALGIIMLFGA